MADVKVVKPAPAAGTKARKKPSRPAVADSNAKVVLADGSIGTVAQLLVQLSASIGAKASTGGVMNQNRYAMLSAIAKAGGVVKPRDFWTTYNALKPKEGRFTGGSAGSLIREGLLLRVQPAGHGYYLAISDAGQKFLTDFAAAQAPTAESGPAAAPSIESS